MAEGSEDAKLNQLYEELQRFAPTDLVDEMTTLARRLNELSSLAGEPIQEPDFSKVWDRIEPRLDGERQ